MQRHGRPSPAEAAAAAARAAQINREAQQRAAVTEAKTAISKGQTPSPAAEAERQAYEKEKLARRAERQRRYELSKNPALTEAVSQSAPVHRRTNMPLDQSTAMAEKYVNELQQQVLANDPNAWRHPELPEDLYHRALALDNYEKALQDIFAQQNAALGRATPQISAFTPEEEAAAMTSHTKSLLDQLKPEAATQYVQSQLGKQNAPAVMEHLHSLESQLRGEKPFEEGLGVEREKLSLPGFPQGPGFAPGPRREQEQNLPFISSPAEMPRPYANAYNPFVMAQRIPSAHIFARENIPNMETLNPYIQRLMSASPMPQTQYVPMKPKPKLMEKVMRHFGENIFHPEHYPEE